MRAAWGWRGEDAVGHGNPWKEERRRRGRRRPRRVDLLCALCCLCVMKEESFQALVMRPRSFWHAFIARIYNARVGVCHRKRKGIEKRLGLAFWKVASICSEWTRPLFGKSMMRLWTRARSASLEDWRQAPWAMFFFVCPMC